MPTTSLTLLGRLRDPADALAWREFDTRYRELIVRFLQSRAVQIADAEDIAQAVLAKLVSGLRAFEYDAARGGFRAYLFRCTRSGLSDHYTRQNHRPAQVSLDTRIGNAQTESEDEAAFEREWIDHHYRLAVQRYRQDADSKALAILDATISGRSVRNIAEENGMTDAAVYKAQQRLRDRLKEFIAQQLADEEERHERRSD